jgi:L-asparaginase
MNHQDQDLNPKQTILVMTTGGTIDKTYDERDGTLENRESAMRERLQTWLRLPYKNLEVLSLMSKDSLHMNDFDRALITKAVELHMHKGHPIIVIHGTDTMSKSAEYLARKIKVSVPVIFTGAMKPMEVIGSDALQNVAEALMVAELVSPAIYISFHGRLFAVPEVRKNRDLGTFEAYKA